MLVAMEFSAFRQRWVAGIEVDNDPDTGEAKQPFKSGVDQLWVSSDPGTTFGDFNTSNLDQFLKVKDSFRVDMASVTGTPLHYFLQTSRGFASGEALKQNETRFLAKVGDRQVSFGQTWAELMSFALRLSGHGDGVELITNWEDPSPTSEKDILENILLKKQIGVSTTSS
jgi:Phage portal protein, SPP1 Gp6-like.